MPTGAWVNAERNRSSAACRAASVARRALMSRMTTSADGRPPNMMGLPAASVSQRVPSRRMIASST